MIRADLRETPGYKGLDIGMHDVGDCVPESLQMFLNLLFGGERLLDDETIEEKENEVRSKALSVAQDIVYGVSNAESVLNTLDEKSGTVIPPNLVQGNFVHFSADNIHILDETLDGKNTFHATQIAAWQRGAENSSLLDGVNPSKKRSLNIPESMDKIETIVARKINPVFIKAVMTTWYDQAKDKKECKQAAKATDLAFNMLRSEGVIRSGWTEFNQSLSRGEVGDKFVHEVTKVGYMPIIQAPAHEMAMDTLYTVVKKCMHVATVLGQQYTIITVDQALYCKLVELKWAIPEYREKLVVQIGGLHISMCFLKTIGDHMKGSGLVDSWIE
ncbi:Hypothetical predicted protein [Paramuricea clavata]|uniref:Uncharacterized protein n=1 Tax=Paramuricea clavata TaxID=317549 RepID=A0A6S7GP52_PARCT|nr:Hypothetical predicted protein [Paramuricea clavata]